VSGAVCIATGVGWTGFPESGPFGVFLLVLSLLGGVALAALGWWQSAAGPKTRVFVIVVLAGLAGAYIAAGTVGLLLAQNSPYDLGLVIGLSWAGVVAGGVLYLLCLVAGFSAIGARDRALNDQGR
jgi:hypothetical protein